MIDSSLILNNFLSPPVLFFFLGVLAILVRSDVEIPAPIPKILSIYLLTAIGLKGGFSLAAGNWSDIIFRDLGLCIFIAILIPFIAYLIIRSSTDRANAAAIAGTYGSVSAVTFVTATSFLGAQNMPYDGHWVAGLAIMESPAIIFAVAVYRMSNQSDGSSIPVKHLLKDAFLNSSVFLLLGSMLIGFLSGAKGQTAVYPYTNDLFYGILMIFLLDMGLVAARKLKSTRSLSLYMIVFALIFPLVSAGIAISISVLLKMDLASAFLFTILAASASYIAVPAALRLTIPEANPGIYVTMSLAITFPLNIIVGIPLYFIILRQLLL